ncbi:hypothetical protein [Niabella hibiscisoli]|uniref:hypothetical protein n=1 Tax=Niabella hibiscisoli TaxID=1825928 RepID=UPI001F0D201F|nr:hypothetical protein [Niabella hibiscisoli]MCH5715674.1 hypothetical protein [Niabella hibiscisoli]
MKIQINDTNYSYYKKICEIIWSHYKTLFPPEMLHDDSDPVAILNKWEQKSKSIAKRGLKAGLQDLVSNIKEFPPNLKRSIDKDLAANNLPSLRDLQGVVEKTIARVLNRRKINSLEEFYIVKEEVIDQTTDMVDDVRVCWVNYLQNLKFQKARKTTYSIARVETNVRLSDRILRRA